MAQYRQRRCFHGERGTFEDIAERRTRHIGDFRKWKDHDEYQKALARLIRDLQSDDKAKPASI